MTKEARKSGRGSGELAVVVLVGPGERVADRLVDCCLAPRTARQPQHTYVTLLLVQVSPNLHRIPRLWAPEVNRKMVKYSWRLEE